MGPTAVLRPVTVFKRSEWPLPIFIRQKEP